MTAQDRLIEDLAFSLVRGSFSFETSESFYSIIHLDLGLDLYFQAGFASLLRRLYLSLSIVYQVSSCELMNYFSDIRPHFRCTFRVEDAIWSKLASWCLKFGTMAVLSAE